MTEEILKNRPKRKREGGPIQPWHGLGLSGRTVRAGGSTRLPDSRIKRYSQHVQPFCMSIADRISSTELRDLLLSLAALVVAFSVLMNGKRIPDFETILIITVGVGTGFLLHEMAHKFVALHFGYFAEYRANPDGAVVRGSRVICRIHLRGAWCSYDKQARCNSRILYARFLRPGGAEKRDKKGDALDIPGRAHDQHHLNCILFLALLFAPSSGTAAMAAKFALFINLT